MKHLLFPLFTVSVLLVSCNEAKIEEIETPSEIAEDPINSDSMIQIEKPPISLKDGKIPTH